MVLYLSPTEEEWDSLKDRIKRGDFIVTTRVGDESGKYKRFQEFIPDFDISKILIVTGVERYHDIRYHPYYEELTKEQIKEVSEYPEYDVLFLISLDSMGAV